MGREISRGVDIYRRKRALRIMWTQMLMLIAMSDVSTLLLQMLWFLLLPWSVEKIRVVKLSVLLLMIPEKGEVKVV